MIVLERNELMNSRMSGSEEALATMTCERLGGRIAPHLLIGGYGMGFTLRAVLGVLGAGAGGGVTPQAASRPARASKATARVGRDAEGPAPRNEERARRADRVSGC